MLSICVKTEEQRGGKCWHTCVDAGEGSYFNHHFASLYDFFVRPKHPRGTTWTSGRLYLLSFAGSSSTNHQVWITSSLHSSTTIACCKSNSHILQVQNLDMSQIR